MNVATEVEEEDLRTTKYPKLRVLTGGKGPPEPPTDTWLLDLEVGSVFVARQNDKACDWEMYFLISKMNDDLYLLNYSVPDGKVWSRHIDPKLFCNHHRDYKVLWVHKQQEETDVPEQCDLLQPD